MEMNHMNMEDMNMGESANHGMLLFGEETAYLSHLPMFGSPHNYQAIFEVMLSKTGIDPMAVYVDDRKAHSDNKPEFKMYSFVPTQDFVLTNIVTPPDEDHPQLPLRSFPGNIWRGHFEPSPPMQHFVPQGEPVPELSDARDPVVADVTKVVLFRQLDAYALAPPLLLPLEYFLFGKAQELFLAHVITQPPDFDQVLGIQVDGFQFTDDELRHGLLVTFPGRANSEDQKIKEQEQITGQVQIPGQIGSRPREVQIKARVEFYFETGDLSGLSHSVQM